MDHVAVSATELPGILRSLGAPAIRERPDHPGQMLNGYCTGKPTRVTADNGFAIHFVERQKRV